MKKVLESEKVTEKYLVAKAKKLGGIALKFASTVAGGYPDRFCLFPGSKIFFCELKSEGQKPRELQLVRINFLRKLGFDVYVCDTKAAVDEMLKDQNLL